MKRITSLIVLLGMLASLAACASDTASEETAADTTAADTTAAVTEPAETDRSQIKDDLPDGLDFEGRQIRIIHRSDGADLSIEVDAEQTGDVVDEAIFERNLTVEERINVDIVAIPIESTIHDSGHVNDKVRTSVTAGSDDYDISFNHMYGTTPLTLEGMFVDVYDIDYLNFDQPWWAKSFMDEATLFDHCYFAAGDISLTLIQSMYLIFCNHSLYDDYYDERIYDIVMNGEWTMDKLAELAAGVYSDLNGNSEYDMEDRYGYSTTGIRLIDGIMLGCDINFTERDSDGLPYFTIEGNERILEFVEKMSNIYKSDTITMNVTESAVGETEMLTKFTGGDLLFIPYTAMGASSLRDMEDNFGAIPSPKLNEAQDDYTSCVHDGFSSVVVLTTCPDLEAVGAAIEALCAESYRNVTTAYYETALKVKYSRDDETSQMLDMIREKLQFDFAFIYGSSLNNAVTQFRNIVKGESDAVVSTIASNMVTCNAKLAELLEKYEANE